MEEGGDLKTVKRKRDTVSPPSLRLFNLSSPAVQTFVLSYCNVEFNFSVLPAFCASYHSFTLETKYQ